MNSKQIIRFFRRNGNVNRHVPGIGDRIRERAPMMAPLLSAAVALMIAVAPSSQAALLSLSQTPLFAQNAVQPNIFYMLDDSGSMDWEFIYNDGTGLASDTDPLGIFYMGDQGFGLIPGSANQRLYMCRGYNTFAYDPTSTYTPWVGRDNGGATFQNAYLYGGGTEAAPNWNVRNDPYTTASTTFNLGAANIEAYWTWTDSNANNAYDAGECGDTTSNAGGIDFASLSIAQQKNFANWYSYYRKREYVLKRAVSELFLRSQARVGFSTLHRNGTASQKVENVDDISLPVNTTAQTNKTNLLAELHQNFSSGGTPLRLAMDRVGRYFRGGDSTAFTALFGSGAALHTTAETVDARSPILNSAKGGECQQNFLVLMTDGYYNGGYSGGTAVGNADNSGSGSVFYSPTSQYGDGQSATLGDIAMHYYKNDLATSLVNRVPYSAGLDPLTPGTLTPGDAATFDDVPAVPAVEAGTKMHQHMVSYTVAFGLSGNLDPFGTKNASACDTNPADPCWGSAPNPYGGWPNVSPATMENDPEAVDDLWHAAHNSRGLFLSAKNPIGLVNALNNAIVNIQSRTGTGSTGGASGSSAATTTRLYIPQYVSSTWSGGLIALQFTFDVAGNFTGLADTNDWLSPVSDAGLVLNSQVSGTGWNSNRAVVTSNGGAGTGKAFRWTSLTSAQQSQLDQNFITSTADGLGQARLEWLRGSRANEGATGTLRTRSSTTVLGDIANSAAVHVGPPESFYPDTIESAPWSAFRAVYANRKPMLYVGANDGMLHGFGACTGNSSIDPSTCTALDRGYEKIAFVPNSVFSKLNRVPDKSYSHQTYVDGTPVVGDVFINGQWRTVLVGGLRAGGQGIYALDVTDPSSFSEANAGSIVLWEFTDDISMGANRGSVDLGYTYGTPVLAKMNNNRWAAIFGNGYNNSEADGRASTSGQAALFVVDIETGTTIQKISVTGGSVATPNGLSTPRVVDVNSDGKADFAYAGDLLGNIWKFDLRDTNAAPSWTASRLFTATDPGNNPQPITSKPEITYHPDGQLGIMVYFGTGKFIEGPAIDTSSIAVQSFYGVWDRDGRNGPVVTQVNKNELLNQTLSTTSTAIGSVPARTVTDTQIAGWGIGASQHMGWKVDFTLFPGERVIANPDYWGLGRIHFSTIKPDVDPCGTGGDTWEYQLNTRNGGRPPQPVWDYNNDYALDAGDNTSSGDVNVGIRVGLGGVAAQPIRIDTSSGRQTVSPGTGAAIGSGATVNKSDKDPSIGRQGWRQNR
jgi:type IV pilus assembly protein PilY1